MHCAALLKAWNAIEQLDHLLLRQPDDLALKPDLDLIMISVDLYLYIRYRPRPVPSSG